jgi:hypothetical protein
MAILVQPMTLCSASGAVSECGAVLALVTALTALGPGTGEASRKVLLILAVVALVLNAILTH